MNPFAKAQSVKLLRSGNSFFDAVKLGIDEAKQVIHLQTYIFSNDETGKEISDSLISAAKRGVQVFLVIDKYGSKELPASLIEKWKLAGIQFRFFSPFFSSEDISFVRRLHHKILVVDKQLSIIGGINIGDKYHGSATTKPWLDFAVLVKGNCNEFIHELCDSIFHKRKRLKNEQPSIGLVPVEFKINDWFKRKNQIYKTYLKGVKSSQKSITIIGSYFLPGYFFIRQLKHAAKRGVKIRIMVGAVSDIALFHHAEKYLYPYLIRHGIEVYEWQDSVMHGKVAVFDESKCTIGSYNLNNLSKYQCIELNVDVMDTAFGIDVSQQLNTLFDEGCRRVTADDLTKHRNFFSYVKSAFAYYMYKLFMYLIVPVE